MKRAWNLKKILKELLLGILLLFILSNVISYLRKPELKSTTFPITRSPLIDGNYFDTRDTYGKPLLVHFWATWCPTCKLEASNIQAVSKKYNVLSIAVESGSDDALLEYMKQNNFDFDVVNDKYGHWAKEFNIAAFPTTFIYNSKGELSFSEVGYSTTAGLLLRLKLIEND